jgi:hypothetical protein
MDSRKEPGLHYDPQIEPQADPQPRATKPPNYVALSASIALGIIIAYLAVGWIATQYATYMARQAFEEINRSTQKTLEKINAQAKAQQQAQIAIDRERRASDATGSKLSRQCGEWTRVAEQLKSDYAIQEKARFCGQFQAYVVHSTFPRP